MSKLKWKPDDILMWPDDYWCYVSEYDEHPHRSDDVEHIPEGSEKWISLHE